GTGAVGRVHDLDVDGVGAGCKAGEDRRAVGQRQRLAGLFERGGGIAAVVGLVLDRDAGGLRRHRCRRVRCRGLGRGGGRRGGGGGRGGGGRGRAGRHRRGRRRRRRDLVRSVVRAAGRTRAEDQKNRSSRCQPVSIQRVPALS